MASAPNLQLVRLLQLASPALPIGGFSYSQGLERAVEDRWVTGAASAQAWIGDLLCLVVARGEAAVLWRLLAAVPNDPMRFGFWDTWFLASRESAELHAETLQMGGSLWRLATDLRLGDRVEIGSMCGSNGSASGGANASASANGGGNSPGSVATGGGRRDLPGFPIPRSLPAAFARVAAALGIDAESALLAYLWSWLENQVIAAIKLVPLGQVAGQRILLELGPTLVGAATTAMATGDDDIGTFAPGLALASVRHETQYSRLFRS